MNSMTSIQRNYINITAVSCEYSVNKVFKNK